MIARLLCWWAGHIPRRSYWVTSEGIGKSTCIVCGTSIEADLREVQTTGSNQEDE